MSEGKDPSINQVQTFRLEESSSAPHYTQKLKKWTLSGPSYPVLCQNSALLK